MTQCREKVRQFIQDNLMVSVDQLSDDEDFFEKRFVNSLFAMQLVNFIEGEIQVEIDGDDLSLSNFSTVNRIMALVEKTLNKESVHEGT